MAASPHADAPKREYIRFEIVDLNGKALSKTVPARHRGSSVFMYSGALAMGGNAEMMTFPEEVASAGCPNWQLVPDWSTEQVLPWASGADRVVRRVYCEHARGAGAAAPRHEAVPRTVCRRLLQELREFGGHGYEMLIGGELEFTVARRDGSSWVPLFNGVDIFATLQNNKAMDFAYEVERHMEPVGVDIMTMNAEYGAGQLELVFAPKFGIEAADATSTFRTGTKEIAQRQGLLASFMSRPFGVSGVGNGGHFNFSLWAPAGAAAARGGDDVVSRVTAGKVNVLHSAEDPDGLTAVARSFLAGVLAHAPALEALCSPTPPCYTRHGHWAPTVANWGPEDRMAAVRVKADRSGSPQGCYMELRMPSASANVYLVVAGLVAAGLDGLERNLQLPPARQTQEQGAQALPTSLPEAIAALEADDYMVRRLGKDLVRWFAGVKGGEVKFLQDKLAQGSGSDEELSAAWQHLYLEYI